MLDILHDFPIRAPARAVFDLVSTPRGLDVWWTLRSEGQPLVGETFTLFFGPEYDWRARVTRCDAPHRFELEMVEAMPDWIQTRVSFALEERGETTWLRFAHTGWSAADEHYRISNCCWAMYLRVLRRHLEHGESVPYDQRLDV